MKTDLWKSYGFENVFRFRYSVVALIRQYITNIISNHHLPQYGYTIMAEGKTQDTVLPAGKYKLRLVGSLPNLLTPARDIATAGGISTQEVKEYYVEEKHNVMFRYEVQKK